MIKVLLVVFISLLFLCIGNYNAYSSSLEVKLLKKEVKILKTRLSVLENKIKKIETKKKRVNNKKALSELRKKALSEIGGSEVIKKDSSTKEVTYTSHGIGLQRLNPEISATGDFLSWYKHNTGIRGRTNATFRTLGLHINAYVDPYTLFKSALEFHEGEEAELGEAYITRFGFWKNVDLTIGKFRQQFGVINRWHKHALDQVDFPLGLRKIFGDGGLNQTGISIDWNIPSKGRAAQNITYQLTKGKNGLVYKENSLSEFSHLIHYKNYKDIDRDNYFEYGLTALLGQNDRWDTTLGQIDKRLYSNVYGLDFTYRWEPEKRMKYDNFEWRTELYYVDKKIMRPDGSQVDKTNPLGAYTTFQRKISRTIDLGLKLDYFKGDEEKYNYLTYSYNGKNPHAMGFCPYLTYYQSPFLRYRLEFDHTDYHNMGLKNDNTIFFQVIWAAGPHLHDRY